MQCENIVRDKVAANLKLKLFLKLSKRLVLIILVFVLANQIVVH